MSPFVIASGSIAVIGMLFYIHSIWTAVTTPHRTTRFVILLITLLGAIGLYSAHDTPTFILYCIYSTSSLIIFLLSIKRGTGGWATTDIICLIIALIGIIIWQVSGNPIVVVVSSVIASFVGTVPAFMKTHRSPKSEYWVYYVCSFFANGLIYFAHSAHTISNSIYPVYYVLWNLAFLILIFRPQKAKI
jgi:hypothetical protein